MIDIAAIRFESRRYIATEGRVPVLELIEGLDGHEQLQALDAILDVLHEHLLRMKASAGDLGRNGLPSSTGRECCN